MKKIIIFFTSLIVILLIAEVLTRPDVNKIEVSQIPNIPYPTGIFPEDFLWSNSNCIYYYAEEQLFDYCIYEGINKISNIEQKHKDILQRQIRIGQSYFCDIYNFVITDPNQIATKIYIYSYAKLSSSTTLESNLTLRVDECDDQLILSNAFPSLENKQYIWKHTNEFPSEKENTYKNIEIETNENITTLFFEEQTLISFQSVATFIQALPNENNNKFGLIDSYGELWILER